MCLQADCNWQVHYPERHTDVVRAHHFRQQYMTFLLSLDICIHMLDLDVCSAEVDGPFVTLRFTGRFWHKRSDVLARVGAYLKQRIPEVRLGCTSVSHCSATYCNPCSSMTTAPCANFADIRSCGGRRRRTQRFARPFRPGGEGCLTFDCLH